MTDLYNPERIRKFIDRVNEDDPQGYAHPAETDYWMTQYDPEENLDQNRLRSATAKAANL